MPGHTELASDHQTPETNDNDAGYVSEGPVCESTISIIGMGCRFPGSANNPSKFWDLMVEGNDVSGMFSDKINGPAFYHPNRHRPGSFCSAGAYFVDEEVTSRFDASFFSINPKEASSMDPIQRVLLETVYEALESSGQTLQRIKGTKCGVWIGNMNTDHQVSLFKDPEYLPPYAATGCTQAIVSNRISYVFDLHGPSLTVDTACSSSLYALYLAETALKAGHCNMAIVGGTNLIGQPDGQLLLSKLGVLSPTSRCHTFDESADGYGRSEGIGVVILKRTSDAIRDGDPIRAIIRAVAANSNGRGTSITRPSGQGQANAILDAYRMARLDFSDTPYFECHGTGTVVGDTTEIQAISKVGECSRERKTPLLLGSLKGQLGHSEGASGIAGIIRATLMVENELILSTVGIETLNPKLDLAKANAAVVTETTNFPEESFKRVSVNSSGFGGANAHAIVERPGMQQSLNKATKTSKPGANGSREDCLQLLVFSAHEPGALRGNIDSVLQISSQYTPVDLAYTLSDKRSRLSNRAFCTSDAASAESCKFGSEGGGDIYLVFNGQGALYPGVATELLQIPRFVSQLSSLQVILNNQGTSMDLLEEIRRPTDTSRLQDPLIAQPISTAIQICLFDLLCEFGLDFRGTVGHSSGEIAAGYAAGRLSESEAMTIAFLRGKLVSDMNKARGAMLAVGLSPEHIAPFLEVYAPETIRIACLNSSESVTISGDYDVVMRLKQSLDNKGVFNRHLRTADVAYHSHHMRIVGEAYENAILKALPEMVSRERSPVKEFFSSTYGGSYNNPLDAQYWRRNMEQPVHFSQAVESIQSGQQGKAQTMLELGADATLKRPLNQLYSANSSPRLHYIPSLLKSSDALKQCLNVAGGLFLLNHSVNLNHVNKTAARREINPRTIVDLPTYSWNHVQVYTAESRASKEWRQRRYPRHDILGSRISPEAGKASLIVWRNRLSVATLPWLGDHQVGNDAIFPGVGYLCMAIEALGQALNLTTNTGSVFYLRDVTVPAALVIPLDSDAEVFFHLSPVALSDFRTSTDWFEFSVTSIASAATTTHCRGSISASDNRKLESLRPGDGKANRPENASDLYKAFAQEGLKWGPSFQRLTQIFSSKQERLATGKILEHHDPRQSSYAVHPTILDSCLQLMLVSAQSEQSTKVYLPVSFPEVIIKATSGSPTTVVATSERKGFRGLYGSAWLSDQCGQPIACFKQIQCTMYTEKLGATAITRPTATSRAPYMKLDWKPDISVLGNEDAWRITAQSDSGKWIDILDDIDDFVMASLSDFANKYPEFLDGTFVSGNDSLAMLVQWIGITIKELEDPERYRSRLAELSDRLIPVSLEVKLMARIVENLPAILREGVTGIEVAMRDNLWSQIFQEGSINATAYPALVTTLELLAHKTPNMNCLEVGAGTGGATGYAVDALQANGAVGFQRYVFTDIGPSFLTAAEERFRGIAGFECQVFDMEVDVEKQNSSLSEAFDLVISSQALHATKDIASTVKNVRKLLKPGGRLVIIECTQVRAETALLLGMFTGYWRGYRDGKPIGPFLNREEWNETLKANGFSGNDLCIGNFPGEYSNIDVIVSTAVQGESLSCGPNDIFTPPRSLNDTMMSGKAQKSPLITLVHLEAPTLFSYVVQSHLQCADYRVARASIATFTPVKDANVVVLAELEQPVLADMPQTALGPLKQLFAKARSVLWVTNGSLLSGHGPDPKLVAASHLFPTLAQEYPSLQLQALDLDANLDKEFERSASAILRCARNIREGIEAAEPVLWQSDGILHSCRFRPAAELNTQFRERNDGGQNDRKLVKCPIDTHVPLRIDFEIPGVVSSFYFREERSISLGSPLERDEVLIKVAAVGLNTKDISVIACALDRNTCSLEYTGFVEGVGAEVSHIKVGDRVLCLSHGNFGNYLRIKACLCQPLHDPEDIIEMASFPVAYTTAVLSLRKMAQLREGETVLIQSATGALGQAAIAVAKALGAKIFATVGSDERRRLLIEHHGIPEDRIFKSRVISALDDMLGATGGVGFDVVLSNASGDYFHEVACKSVAPFGRLIDVGRMEVLENGKLRMGNFSRNMTLISFDLGNMLEERPELTGAMLEEAAEFYRQESLRPIQPISSYDVSNLDEALRRFGRKEHSGKIVINYRGQSQMVKMRLQPKKDTPTSSLKGTYLLAGCLGGLGKRIASWMVGRGADSLVFLSRSGVVDTETEAFVKGVEASGASVTVIKGDVAVDNDVADAVAACGKSLKGVVQASAVFESQMFEDMTPESWANGLRAKVQGTLNLHHATQKLPIEHFICVSSLIASCGIPGESSYSVANGFLDQLIRHRRSIGLPGSCIELGMVLDIGHVSQHDLSRRSLERNGHYGIPADDLLKLLDPVLAATNYQVLDFGSDGVAVTGLEADRLAGSISAAGMPLWTKDPRFSHVVQAAERAMDARPNNGDRHSNGTGFISGDTADDLSTPEAISSILRKRLAKLLYVDEGSLNDRRNLRSYGVDSMVAAEFRAFLHSTWSFEASFLSLIGPEMTLEVLVKQIATSM